ncbi:MAG: RNA-binding S4 domain-containing protein [Actinomyces succiniciruminis]|uniref:RNA-binding S4 domain n=1 Tax=Actinomyces succiniciruminis TaxID=1522002 RepID=A0A1L7RAZ4_9ACTO|nr:RNA-binding S4 domain-containing protein [Actinomyces succiniciruminis]MBE6474019.1 RNA-binding S4 domain-containing protein [Actinomyces succiniciruminis]CED91025.1 RNA-binding S4 domain [Actinomyces succiniciruminis]
MSASAFPSVPVSGEIKLGQFLKLAGLVEDGADARIAIQSGDVTVNGEVETRRGHRLADGDVVVVDLPTGAAGAVVTAAS